MNFICTLTTAALFFLSQETIAQSSNENNAMQEVVRRVPIEQVKDHQIDHINIYPNELQESFVLDFYDRGFDELTVIVRDETGKTLLASFLQQVQAGEFKKFNLPKNQDREVVYVIIKTEEGELVRIFNT